MKDGLKMGAFGACIGLLGVWAAQKRFSRMLLGISAVDPLTLAGAAVFLLMAVLLARWVPAWRAARVDPPGGASRRIGEIILRRCLRAKEPGSSG